jgi:hypothetical protein
MGRSWLFSKEIALPHNLNSSQMKLSLLPLLAFSVLPDSLAAQDPHVIWDLTKPSSTQFATDVATAGDLNLDGHSDFMASSTAGMEVFSGADGTVLLTISMPFPWNQTPTNICTIGDVNGDGLPDYAASDVSMDRPWGADVGGVAIFSGADASTLWYVFGEIDGWQWGESLAAAGDVNGDGIPDLMVGSSKPVAQMGLVRIYSGANGNILNEMTGFDFDDLGFGNSVAKGGDVNRDGFDDYIVGASHDGQAGFQAGMARVYSG